MRLLILALLLILMAVLTSSCSNSNAQGEYREKAARAHRVWRSNYDGKWRSCPNIDFITVDTLAVKGDTLLLDLDYYVIDSVAGGSHE